ncbi:unnamed protein product [Camellia sinensis]
MFDQRFSLLKFKTTFTITANASLGCESDSHPKMVFWNESSDCCLWEGVTCDWLNGHVIGLDLNCSHLQGTIQPNTTLFHFRYLQTLNLAFNDFNFSTISPDFGSFPKISHLSKLISLDLSYNELGRLGQHTFNMLLRNLTQLRELHLDSLNISSPLPHALLNLSSLTSLSLRNCQLRGKFSENIFHFPNLRELYVGGNWELTGKLPYFNATSSLQFLDLGDISFSGQLPESINNLKALNILSLSYCNLSGSIPASVWNLTKITDLDFSSNSFSGQIPSSISNLAKLRGLDLFVNNLNGQIPDSLGNMSQLTNLYLFANNLSGQTPDSLGNMSQLTNLALFENNLNGQIPDSLGNMSQLTSLDLSYNSLNGTIPSSLFALPSLVEIGLSNNKLQGPIPGLVYELQNLTYLWVSSNNLSGVVDLDKLLKLKNLISLDLSYNGLSLSINNSVNSTLTNFETIRLASCNLSEFPNFLREQARLSYLDLSNNQIHGEVPKWLFNVGKDSLQTLNLSHNCLSSLERLPWKNLEYINLHSNLLQGSLPVPPNFTYVFSISNNKVTGEIPTLICNLRWLGVLDLSNNSLSGLIPQCLGNFSNSLSVLNLGNNRFRSTFTMTFTKGNMVRNLNLNGNQIEGQVSRSLLNCKDLEVLDLGKNKINDTFPHWLGTLRNLQVLVLRFNRFHGHIGTSKTKGKHPFPKLRIIDVSYNEFTGLLPTNYIKQFRAMINVDEHEMKLKYMGDNYYQDSVVVMIKGYEIELSRILTVLSIIDFSRNKFQGEIPKSIGRLNSLRGLNISHKNLTGHIPTSLGNLKNLESLDLSSNKLVGEIPQQLTNLMFLEVLNLSENQLAGPIPQGRQFYTFENDSYSGNLAFCGIPLSILVIHISKSKSKFISVIQIVHLNDSDRRTIVMKLLYYDDVMPVDYEPPFFRSCSEQEAHNPWIKNPLEMEVGNVNSKHLVLALKVKSVFDPCEDENDDIQDDDVSLGADSVQRECSESDSEVGLSEDDQYIVATIEIMDKLVKEGILSKDGTDSYTINKQKALYHALPMSYVTVATRHNPLRHWEADNGNMSDVFCGIKLHVEEWNPIFDQVLTISVQLVKKTKKNNGVLASRSQVWMAAYMKDGTSNSDSVNDVM